MSLISIHDQNLRPCDYNMVDFDTLEGSSNGAYPVNFAGEFYAWRDKYTAPDGSQYEITFGFSEAEGDTDDASNLPWDADHVVRCELVD